MPSLLNGPPTLSIALVDDEWADLTISQPLQWTDIRTPGVSHRLVVNVFGDDNLFRGGDNSLGVYFTREIVSGTRTFVDRHRMERDLLDEDTGRGLIGRAKRRRDEDEIYVVTWPQAFAWVGRWGPGGGPGVRREWTEWGDNPRQRSNTIGGIRF